MPPYPNEVGGRAILLVEDSYKFCRYWSSLQNLLRTRYTSHLLYASEADCKEPNVEQELELEKSQLSDLVA